MPPLRIIRVAVLSFCVVCGFLAGALVFALGCTGMSNSAARRKPTRGHVGVIFRTVDEAAVGGCKYIWTHEPRSERFEYCGVIYRDEEGIKAGLPETDDSATGCSRPLEPPGTTAEAGYHDHRQTSDFSPGDRKIVTPLAMYLCTPGGVVKRMTSGGTVIVK